MKRIKTITITILLIIFTCGSYAQTGGMIGGFNLASMVMKNNNYDLSKNMKLNPGIQFGGFMGIPVTSLVSIEPAIFMMKRGFTYKVYIEDEYYSYSDRLVTNLIYIDIVTPVRFRFDVGTPDLFIQGGPYVAFGVGGRTRDNADTYGLFEGDHDRIEWGKESYSDIKRVDFGMAFYGGIVINHFQIGLNYSLGLLNISPDNSNGQIYRNRVFGILAGFRFGNEKK